MAKYKDYSYGQELMLPINLSRQILPGSFEYTLNKIVNENLDLSIFAQKFNNDDTGAPAYDPAILLKIILFAYSKGIITSRKIADLCHENIVCIALSADTQPHFTTIANFVSSMDKECVNIFTRILSICYTENLIGKNMFAIDGCKISSNCSKEWSGTKSDLFQKVGKIKKAIDYLVTKHKESDKNSEDEAQIEKEKKSILKLQAKADKISHWLDEHEDRMGTQGKPIKSNIIDNESAKMATSHGVIQGYNGIAAVDDKHQIIVWAEAFGDANESSHLPEILTGIKENCQKAEIDEDVFKKVKITADSGFHNEYNVKMIYEEEIDAYIADNQFRKRDVRFDEVGKYKKKISEWQPSRGKKYFTPGDFFYNNETGKLICPAGNPMWVKNKNFKTCGNRYMGVAYMGHIHLCKNCALRSQCIRKETTKARQVAIFNLESDKVETNFTSKMKVRFDTPKGRSIYSRRMGTVEPVFGHIAGTKRLNRFTLRKKKKVNIQWLLFCIMHNIGKMQRYGIKQKLESL